MRSAAAIVSLALLSACAARGTGATGSSRSDSTIPAEEQLVAKFEHLSARVEGTSCDAYATTVGDWVDVQGEGVNRLAQAAKSNPKLPPEQLTALEDRLVAAFATLIQEHEGCTAHARADDAFGRLAALIRRV